MVARDRPIAAAATRAHAQRRRAGDPGRDDDVVAGVRAVAADYRTLDTTAPPVDMFPPLLLVVGILVIIYGGAMLMLTRANTPRRIKLVGGTPNKS